MKKLKDLLNLIATSSIISFIIICIDFIILWLVTDKSNNIASTLSLIVLLEGGLCFVSGSGVVLYSPWIAKIQEVISCTPANVGIFCASYQILKGLLSNGLEKIIRKNKKQIFIEDNGLSASENALMIQDFKSMSINNGAVLLGVCGGRNSEGEDYPGDFMNSVIIAGFPYHLPTPRVDAKIKYYDKVFNKQGWNFAYLYPAIQRANQASGRPIRKINDKGALIFMDSRFKSKRKWISNWVQEVMEVVPDRKNAITQHLYPFWNLD